MKKNERGITIQGFQIIQKLFDGGQSSVYKVLRNCQLYVLKLYKDVHLSKVDFLKQVDCLMNICHKGVISIIDSISPLQIKLDNGQVQLMNGILVQFAQNGDLHKLIIDHPLCQKAARYIFKQLLSLVLYLDSINIYHRDIKPANILLTQNYQIKLIDFGLASSNNIAHHLSSGTLHFMAPEIFKNKPSTLKSQLFSLGVNLFVMCFGFYPFKQAKSTDHLYRLIMEKNYNKFWSKLHIKISSQLKDFISYILCWNPKERLQIDQLLGHQWFNDQDFTQQQFATYIRMNQKQFQQTEIFKNNFKVQMIKEQLIDINQ